MTQIPASTQDWTPQGLKRLQELLIMFKGMGIDTIYDVEHFPTERPVDEVLVEVNAALSQSR